MHITACTVIRIEFDIGWVRLGRDTNPEVPILHRIELMFGGSSFSGDGSCGCRRSGQSTYSFTEITQINSTFMLLAACTYIRIKFGIVWVRPGSDACFPFPISHGIVLILGNNTRCICFR